MQLKIEKIVHGGQGLAHDDNGKTYFIWNALPNEEVEIEVLNKKNGIYEAVATQIYNPSPHRTPPIEDFYLSTAPWQIMDYAYENELKKQIALETYQHLGNLDIQNIEIKHPQETTHYRNKMEYSFYFDDVGQWHIAFFNRGSHRKKPTGTSVLAHLAINEVANQVIHLIRTWNVPIKSLKSMILRVEVCRGKPLPDDLSSPVLLGLFIKDESALSSIDTQALTQIPNLAGLKIYYSRPLSPASTTDKLLFHSGADFITTTINHTQFRYGLMSFFQVNEPIFAHALEDISSYIPENANIVDFFSGVGAIGIGLKDKIESAILVESNAEAVEFAKLNIQINNLTDRYQAICTPTEKANEYLTPDKIIIFDPPRAGLHTDTIQKVLEVQPPQIIYMSCNLSTHARDLALLSEKYYLEHLQLYNFFPQTPHIEGLANLKIKP